MTAFTNCLPPKCDVVTSTLNFVYWNRIQFPRSFYSLLLFSFFAFSAFYSFSVEFVDKITLHSCFDVQSYKHRNWKQSTDRQHEWDIFMVENELASTDLCLVSVTFKRKKCTWHNFCSDCKHWEHLIITYFWFDLRVRNSRFDGLLIAIEKEIYSRVRCLSGH